MLHVKWAGPLHRSRSTSRSSAHSTTFCCRIPGEDMHKSRVLILLLLASLVFSDKDDADNGCVKHKFQQLWSSSLRDAPIVSSPLLLDIDGDGYRDIMVSSSSGEVWALHGENGHVVDNWPFYLEDRSFFASPLPYDLNGDGVDDVILATTDAELLFLQTDNTLLYGETIKLPPLKVRRDWYQLDSSYTANLAAELRQQVGDDRGFVKEVSSRPDTLPSKDNNRTVADVNTKEGDPLFSRHQHERRPSGVAETRSFVFIDPHILATPVLADMNGDGVKDELVVPVSYYFDPNFYGSPSKLYGLGLHQEELINFSAGAIVIVSLSTGQVIRQKLLTLTKVSADQPAYLLASPTVVKLDRNDPLSVVISSVSGELYLLYGLELDTAGGYPITTDSMTGQVAVEDLTGDGVMEIVVADRSGNVICLNRHGKRLWEQETSQSVETSVRFAKFGGSDSMEVIVVTREGAIWVLDGTTGRPERNSPFSLNSHVFSSILLTHLPSPSIKNNQPHLNAVVPSQDGVFIVDLETGCVDRVSSDNLLYTILADHIDPFNVGLEILTTSLSGHLVCYSTGALHPPTDLELSRETWSTETLNWNGFTHKSSSFFLVTDHREAIRDETGSSFTLQFDIHDDRSSVDKPTMYTVVVSIGSRYTLLNKSITVSGSHSSWQYTVPTPPSPVHATVLVTLCNQHIQCDYATFRIRFNMSFHDVLKWCLALPFLGLAASYLWLLRNESTTSLPTTYRNPQKVL